MMKRKYSHLLLMLLALIATTLFSCKKALVETAEDFVTPEQFYKNENQCIAALNGCYNPLNAIFSANLILSTEAVSDLAFLNSSSVDARLEISPANPGMGRNLWTQNYQGIMYCNAAIEGITGAPLTEARKKSLIAEAITLRALYYYVLTSTFGDVPYYTENISSLQTIEAIGKLGRMSAIETRTALIAQLQDYAPSLPKLRTSEVKDNRISSSMAYMLIAKMAIWNKDYLSCINAVKEIKKVYGLLAQYPLTDTYFRNKNTPESIFEVQFTWSATGLKKTTNVAAFFTPAKTASKAIYDGVTIPELGSTANPYASVTPSEYFMSLYDVYDPRRNIILAYTYDDVYFKRPQSANGTGKPWMGAKFWCPGMDNASDGNNQKVFRYADALLLMAEAANESDDIVLAMASINEVKARASASYQLLAYPGKTEFFKELKEERARELMGEYTRKWDLVRWGIFYNSVKETTAAEFTVLNENLKPYHEYYPISDSEVSRSEGRLSNPAYTGQ